MRARVRRALGMTIVPICARGGSDDVHRRAARPGIPPSSLPLPRMSL
jgi:hypothetical protein